MKSSIYRRVVLICLGTDLLFKSLGWMSFLSMLDIKRPAEHAFALKLLFALNVPATALWLAVAYKLLLPVERWQRARADGTLTDAVVQRAGQAIYTAPYKFALTWMLTAVVTFPAAMLLLAYVWPGRVHISPYALGGSVLSIGGVVGGPLSLGFMLLSFVFRRIAGAISLAAHERKICIEARGPSVFVTLLGMAWCLVLTPTSLMGSIAYVASAHAAERAPQAPGGASSFLLTFALSAAMLFIWASLCVGLLAGNIAGPVAHIAATLRSIMTKDEFVRADHIPVISHDEIGDLVAVANEMIDRLSTASRERGEMVKLEVTYAAAREANRAKSEFLANMSHEIRLVSFRR